MSVASVGDAYQYQSKRNISMPFAVADSIFFDITAGSLSLTFMPKPFSGCDQWRAKGDGESDESVCGQGN
jgi:hypothetical protein